VLSLVAEPLKVLDGLLGGLVLARGLSHVWVLLEGFPHGLLVMFLVLMAL
jgi:hypothetical protein